MCLRPRAEGNDQPAEEGTGADGSREDRTEPRPRRQKGGVTKNHAVGRISRYSRSMSLAGALVLVVEDDPSHGTVIQAMLERLGAQVILAANGTEGLDRLEQGHATPDLIVCDLRMPGIDGYEFARRLRAHPRHGQARLIALTGLDPWETAPDTWGIGFDAHLTKPVTLGALAALSRYLSPPRVGRRPNRPPPD